MPRIVRITEEHLAEANRKSLFFLWGRDGRRHRYAFKLACLNDNLLDGCLWSLGESNSKELVMSNNYHIISAQLNQLGEFEPGNIVVHGLPGRISIHG